VRPNAWSHSALDKFESCPRQYHETAILKRWPYSATAEMDWGKYVHKAFENYLLYATPLPAALLMHQDFLDRFKAMPGELAGEERIALDTKLRACPYFLSRDDPRQVWYRGQVDARKRNLAAGTSHLLDHKTGKVKNDFTQLKSFAMFEFLTQPAIHTCTVEYYWTQIKGAAGETYTRAQLPELIAFFAAKLHPFADAFLTNTWTPKTSGLCNGWCPVTTCEFWKPKRPQRT
jgi:hypothetical protein